MPLIRRKITITMAAEKSQADARQPSWLAIAPTVIVFIQRMTNKKTVRRPTALMLYSSCEEHHNISVF
ncbi:hypothetical protein GALL_131780 [mine drainage metagenome]|uniref:Uncharacterized protein n=1 Tax=mine drainage metagenome TaxID=410659 RepID=A0A1J5SL90_9ZZZZ